MEDSRLRSEGYLQEWSRHYDTLLWAVIAVVTAAVGGLMAGALQGDSRIGVLPEMAGVALLLLGTYWVASFRCFRQRLHLCMPEGLMKRLLLSSPRSGLPHQFDALVVLFALLEAGLILLSASKVGYAAELLRPTDSLSAMVVATWPILALAVGSLMIIFRRIGKPRSGVPTGLLRVEYTDIGREVLIAGDAVALSELADLCVAIIHGPAKMRHHTELSHLLDPTSLRLAVAYLPPPAASIAQVQGGAAQQSDAADEVRAAQSERGPRS